MVAPGLVLAAVRVLGGRDHDDSVVEDLLRRAVIAIGELVENAQVGVGSRFLVSVDVPCEPEDRGRARGEVRGLTGRRKRIPQRCGVRTNRREAGGSHVLRTADNRVVELSTFPRCGELTAHDARTARVERGDVGVDLGSSALLRADLIPEHLLRSRNLAAEVRHGLDRITRGRVGAARHEQCDDNCKYDRNGHQKTIPHRYPSP